MEYLFINSLSHGTFATPSALSLVRCTCAHVYGRCVFVHAAQEGSVVKARMIDNSPSFQRRFDALSFAIQCEGVMQLAPYSLSLLTFGGAVWYRYWLSLTGDSTVFCMYVWPVLLMLLLQYACCFSNLFSGKDPGIEGLEIMCESRAIFSVHVCWLYWPTRIWTGSSQWRERHEFLTWNFCCYALVVKLAFRLSILHDAPWSQSSVVIQCAWNVATVLWSLIGFVLSATFRTKPS